MDPNNTLLASQKTTVTNTELIKNNTNEANSNFNRKPCILKPRQTKNRIVISKGRSLLVHIINVGRFKIVLERFQDKITKTSKLSKPTLLLISFSRNLS